MQLDIRASIIMPFCVPFEMSLYVFEVHVHI